MQTPWGEFAVADAHVHFFSRRFFAAMENNPICVLWTEWVKPLAVSGSFLARLSSRDTVSPSSPKREANTAGNALTSSGSHAA